MVEELVLVVVVDEDEDEDEDEDDDWVLDVAVDEELLVVLEVEIDEVGGAIDNVDELLVEDTAGGTLKAR